MKKYLIGLLGLLAISCSRVEECFQATGEMETRTVFVDDFEQIIINPRVKVILQQGDAYQLRIYAGANLQDQVRYTVQDGVLELFDDNTCNYSRSYGSTTVYVIAPNIQSIYNFSEQKVTNTDTLRYSALRLYGVELFGKTGVGDFDLTLEADYVSAESNFVSQFKLNGKTHTLFVGFYHGMSRFEGDELQAKNAVVYHRGSNDVTVRVTDTLRAELRSTGDLISKTPSLYKEIDRTYTGQFYEQFD